jgi:hypothetical protein
MVPLPPLDLSGGTGAISGIVVDALTGRPVQGAIVTIAGISSNIIGGATRQLTGRDGQFVFTSLPPADGYSVGATKFGYLASGYGRKTPQGSTRRIALRDGQWFADARITLWRPGAISGIVTDEAGEPVVGAYVRLLPQLYIGGTRRLVAGPVVRTDDRGMYRIAGLLPGRYLVSVPSVQWAVPASTSLLTLSGTTAERVAAAEAAGREVPLQPHPIVPLTEGLALVVGSYPTPPPPGSTGSRFLAYPMTFYPQARGLDDALPIELGYGEERTNVDLRLLPVATFTVAGRVEGPEDALTNLTVRLLPAGMENLGHGSEAATTLINADGSFSLINVPSGSYTIMAGRSTAEYRYDPPGFGVSANPLPLHPAHFSSSSGSSAVFAAPAGTMLWYDRAAGNPAHSGRTRVDVDATDVRDVVVTMQHGITLTGRIVEEGKYEGNPRPFFALQAEPADGDATLGQPRARGEQGPDGWTFVLEGLLPGEYLVRLIGGGLVKSIQWQDKDYTYSPFDTRSGREIAGVVITLTDQSARLEGLVRDTQGAPAANAVVIYFPAQREHWSRYGLQPTRVRSVSVSSSGGYRVSGLPAGDYFVIAVDDELIDAWKDPAFLEVAARSATRVALGWGEAKTQELRLQQIKR